MMGGMMGPNDMMGMGLGMGLPGASMMGLGMGFDTPGSPDLLGRMHLSASRPNDLLVHCMRRFWPK